MVVFNSYVKLPDGKIVGNSYGVKMIINGNFMVWGFQMVMFQWELI
jgi:hypothetical protein